MQLEAVSVRAAFESLENSANALGDLEGVKLTGIVVRGSIGVAGVKIMRIEI